MFVRYYLGSFSGPITLLFPVISSLVFTGIIAIVIISFNIIFNLKTALLCKYIFCCSLTFSILMNFHILSKVIFLQAFLEISILTDQKRLVEMGDGSARTLDISFVFNSFSLPNIALCLLETCINIRLIT